MENGRKKMRFEILLTRFFGNFHRILLTNLLFAIPSAVVFAVEYLLYVNVFDHFKSISLPVVLAVLLAALIPLYPFFAGVTLVCRNIARGDSDVQVVSTYFSGVKNNFLPFLLHGVLIYIAAMLSYLAISLYASNLSMSWIFYVLLFVSILIALLLFYAAFYLPLMSVTYDLPLRYVYKNSLLMSFGEFKNNIFATLALAVVFGICFTIVVFITDKLVWLIVLAVLWALLVPAACSFMISFYVYDGMTAIISSKDERSRELDESIQKQLDKRGNKPAAQTVAPEEDFSDIDISALKDTDDYIFHNGKMVKQSTILRILREREEKKDPDTSEESS